jgi:DHA1 family multidrug resistance protein-like MFS transporter
MFNYLRSNETLVILCIEGMIMLMGMGLASPVLPLFAREFGLSITMVGLVITMFAASRALIDIPAGRISDIIGRRPTLIAGPVILAAGSLGCGLSAEYWQLMIFRAVQGAGSGLFTTAAMVMVADISTVANRGRNMSYFQGSLWIGFGLGPFMGGIIGHYFGMRAVFYVYALFSLLSAAWAYFRLPETRPTPGPATDEDAHPAGHMAVTLKQVKELMSNVNFVMICIISLSLFMMSNGSRNQILPLMAHDRLGIGAGEIGIALSIVAGINVIIMFFSGRLSDSLGRKPLIMPGCIMVAGSIVMIAFSYSYEFLILSCVIMGIGIGIAGATPAAYVADILTSKNQSMGLSIFRAVSDVGMMAGPVFLGWLADIEGYNFSLYVSAITLAVAAIAFHALAREHPSFRKT